MNASLPERRGLTALAIIAALMTLLMLASSPQPAWAGGDASLVIGVGRDFLDGPDSRAFVHGSTNAWEALTYLGPDMRPLPWLASSWRVEDGGRRWRFKLRPGVKFHDGSALTAAEAVQALRRIMDHPRYDAGGAYREVAKLEAVGDEVVFSLKRPSPNLASLVAYYGGPILKPSGFDQAGRIQKFIATGPYRLELARPNQSVELTAFGDYWGPKPRYRRVEFRHIPDAHTRVMALLAGAIDAVADVGAILPEQAAELADDPRVELKRREVATTHYLLFNCRRPPFADVRARRWLAELVDRRALVAALAGDSGEPASAPYTNLAVDWAFGLAAPPAAEQPAAPNRPLLILLHAGTTERWPYLDMAQIIQDRLRQAGWPAEIVVSEAGGYYEALRKSQFDLSLQPNTLMTGDPDFFYSYYLDQHGAANQGWRNQRAQELIEAGRRQMDPRARREIYRQLAQIFGAELPLLALYHEHSIHAQRRGLAPALELDQNFRPLLTERGPWEAQ